MASELTVAGPFDNQLATRLMHQRIVVLGQEVDEEIANRICAELLLLSVEDQRRDISLYINSPGGSVSAGLAIYDTMRLIPNDVSTLAMGIAASMGQFLLSAGARGKRFACHTRGSWCARARPASRAPRLTCRSRPRTWNTPRL